jgi:DNA polymerase I
MTTALSEWCNRLPFEEVWVVDTEFYPGRGLANGGRDGDATTPLCLVALELRSGRVVRRWQDELDRGPPYRLDAGALFIGYMVSAELGTHIALGWPQPECALDPYIEFRHHTNDGRIKSGDREKGFYSLDGALRFFHVDGVDTARKTDMRDRIIQGPPFSLQERNDILEYCEDDVRNLARLLPFIMPTIASIPHALARGAFMWPIARQERRGIPLGDGQLLERLRTQWAPMQTDLVVEMDRPFGCYEVVDGVPHWRSHLFAAYLKRMGMSWLMYADGSLDERDQTFRDMEGKYPHIGPLRELRCSLSKLRLNDLAVGNDGRNRTLLGAYGSKTGRNQPSNSKYIFGPAKWIRFLIEPPPGASLIYRDFKQQEPKVAAVLSGDPELLAACESGDVYLGIAKQLGFIRESMSPAEIEAVRAMFKTVVLGIQYGLGARSLAIRTGVSLSEAYEILARLRARFRVFEDYAQNVIDHAGLHLEVSTCFGWRMRCPSGMNKRTIRNFPIQSAGAEILHVASVLAERRGVRIVAPIHDAFVFECKAGEEEEASAALDQAMRDASRIVLRGYELNSDEQIVREGGRFFDKRGVEMWSTVNRLLTKLEGETGERRRAV